jgi:hypothetical protein
MSSNGISAIEIDIYEIYVETRFAWRRIILFAYYLDVAN